MSLTYTFNVAQFRIDYPAFANETDFPDQLLQTNFNIATFWIANQDYGWLNGDARYRALTDMTAHITQLQSLNNKGKTPGIVSGAQVDKVNVSLVPPPVPNQFRWWLSTTSYGAELLALLQVHSVGGMYIGGAPERAAFRGIGRCW